MQERCFALVLYDFRKPYSSMKRAIRDMTDLIRDAFTLTDD